MALSLEPPRKPIFPVRFPAVQIELQRNISEFRDTFAYLICVFFDLDDNSRTLVYPTTLIPIESRDTS